MRTNHASFKQKAMRAARHVICLILASALVFQPVLTTALAETAMPPEKARKEAREETREEAREDEAFHYVAIGDSVAAGFDLETNDMMQNIRTYLPQLNYNNSSDYCYPSLTAAGLGDILDTYGIKDKETAIDYANFGLAAFRVENYIALISDPDYVVDFNFIRNTYINSFAEEKETYDSLTDSEMAAYLDGRRTYDHDSLKELLSVCYNDDDPGNNQYLSLFELSVRYGLSWHDNEEMHGWYEANAGSDALFEDWFNAWYGTYIADYYPRLIHGELAKVHDIFVDNIADADLITLDIGSNNMLYNYLMKMAEDSMGPDAVPAVDEETGLKYYKNLANPLSYIIATTSTAIATGGDSDAALDNIPSLMRIYRSDIDLRDVVEVLNYYSYDTMESTMLSFVDEAMERMPELVDLIEEVNQSKGKKADIMYIGRYPAMGKSLQIDRTIVALCRVMKIVMDRVTALLFRNGTASTDASGMNALSINSSGISDPASELQVFEKAAHEDRLHDPDADEAKTYDDPVTEESYTEDVVLEGITSYDDALNALREAAADDSDEMEKHEPDAAAETDGDTDMNAETDVAEADGNPDITSINDGLYKSGAARSIQGMVQKKTEEELASLIDEAVENLRFNLVYLLFGRTIKAVTIQYNEQLRAFSNERGYKFVDIFDIPDDTRLDPHPLSEGHRYIADQILAAADELYSSMKQESPQTDPTNADPEASSTDPNGTDLNGTIPNGTDPNGTDPIGTDPKGTQPNDTGADADNTGNSGIISNTSNIIRKTASAKSILKLLTLGRSFMEKQRAYYEKLRLNEVMASINGDADPSARPWSDKIWQHN
jgi:hypothetical protein